MIREYWESFIKNTACKQDNGYAGVICFGMDEKACSKAVQKILTSEMKSRIYPSNGYRKAMSGEAKVGDKNIVTDWKGVPCAVIETVNVRSVMISDLTDEICAAEGFCSNLSEWCETQMPFVKTEIEELGGCFEDSVYVTVEEFKLVYPVS